MAAWEEEVRVEASTVAEAEVRAVAAAWALVTGVGCRVAGEQEVEVAARVDSKGVVATVAVWEVLGGAVVLTVDHDGRAKTAGAMVAVGRVPVATALAEAEAVAAEATAVVRVAAAAQAKEEVAMEMGEEETVRAVEARVRVVAAVAE